MLINPFASLGDREIHEALLGLAKRERETGVEIILHLLVVKQRQLYVPLGHDSLFSYCTERLGFSRSAAYRRKVVVDRVEEFPALLHQLGNGSLQLCAAATIAPHLTAANADELLGAIAGLSHREVEAYLVKRLRPAGKTEPIEPTPLKLVGDDRPTEAAGVATGRPVAPSLAFNENAWEQSGNNGEGHPLAREAAKLLPRTTVSPLTAGASRVNMTLSESTLAKLKRGKELLADKSDDEIMNRALDELLERIAPERRHARREKRRCRLAAKGNSASNTALHIESSELEASDESQSNVSILATASPANSRVGRRSRRGALADRDRAVVQGNGRCAFVGPDGQRCTARAFIEIDHIMPWSKGGESTAPNFQPLCDAHNTFKGAAIPGA